MLNNFIKLILTLFLLVYNQFNYASNPASTEYVDKKAAVLQAQILALQGSTGTSLKVGQYYQGGVIFYLDNRTVATTPRKGLIAAVADVSGCPTGCTWGSSLGGTSIALFAGQNNTTVMLAAGSDIATAARNYINPQDPSYTDWYLPSLDETFQMLSVIDLINSVAIQHGGTLFDDNAYYWTSSEFDASNAFIYLSTGFAAPGPKTSPGQARAIRTFTY